MNIFCEKCGTTENVGSGLLGYAFHCAICSACSRKWCQYAIDLPELLRFIELKSIISSWELYKPEGEWSGDLGAKMHYLWQAHFEQEKQMFSIAEKWMKEEPTK